MTPSSDTTPPAGNDGEKAKEILEAAAQKAAALIRDTQFALDEANQSLTKAADRINQEGQAQLEHLTQRYDEQFEAASEKLTARLEEQITAFGAQAKQQLYNLEQQLSQFTQERQQQLDQEFRQLQQQRLKQFEHKLQQALPALLEELAGRSLTLTDHEAIIEEQLQQLQQERPWSDQES